MPNFSQTLEDGMFVRHLKNAPSGNTILFIHGLGESGLCFEKLVQRPELQSFNILLPDLPGYGRSPWPAEDPFDLTDIADHLAQWLTQYHQSPVTLVGHSMGGVVALLLAENHPQWVNRVIDIDGNKSPHDCVFSSQALDMGLQGFLDGGFDRMKETIFTRGITDQAQKGYYVSLRLAHPPSYYHHSTELVRLSTVEDMASRLGNLQVPTFYLAGFPHGVSDRSRQLLQAARITIKNIAPSGHWPFIDQEDKFISALMECLPGEF